MAKQGQSMKVPGRKGHGVTGDPHAPKPAPVRTERQLRKSGNTLPAKGRGGKK
jgi:hypothetical protein